MHNSLIQNKKFK